MSGWCCHLAKLFIIFSQNLPGNNSTIWSCFCHIKLPQRKFCTKDLFLSWTNFLELLHPTHPLKIHKPFGSTYFPGVPKLVSPACEYNMNKDKNRVAQFYTKIDLSKLKSNFLVQCLISDGPRVHSLPFINIHKLLKNTNSFFLSFPLCLFKIWLLWVVHILNLEHSLKRLQILPLYRILNTIFKQLILHDFAKGRLISTRS